MKSLIKKLAKKKISVGGTPIELDFSRVYNDKGFYVKDSACCVYTFSFLNKVLKEGKGMSIAGIVTIV